MVVFLLLLDNIHRCQATPAASRTVRFRLQDNTPMDSEIGDISSVARAFEGTDPRHSTATTTTTFSILPDPSSPITRLLWIDVQRGVLKTRDAVDRDALCPGRSDCDLEVNVQVRKPPNSVVVVKALLTLDDDNDNGPIFSQHDFRISLSEATRPGTAVPLPKATDADSPRNGIAKYALANRSPVFYLRQLNDTGAVEVFLTLISELDRESTDRYELHLVAYDGGQPPRSATATILVDVQDVNDNHPVFVKDSYEASIAENVPPNTFVTAVRAADRDVGANGRILYELDPNSPETVRRLFHVDGDTGNVTTRDFLDYETTTVHSFMVFARDRGPDAIPGQVRVVVRVLNVNDNPPNVSIQIANEEDGGGAGGEMSLSELAPLRSVVAYIRVRDADDDDGKDGSESSGVVNCTLSSDDHFQLQPIFRNEYQLVTAKELDRETRPRMSLVVACRDAGGGGGGRPSLTGTASVAIAVEDANDNAPRFVERSYSAEVPEDHPVAEPLLAVSAVDADFGSNADVRYTIEGSDDSSGITIDAVTGVMRSSVPFDRERRQTINVTVTAADAGIPKMTSSVVVSFLILDVDDEVAKFSQDSFTFTLIENQPAGTVIGQVHAFDADLPPFNRLYYHLPENEATAMFRLDPDTGIVYATREFDREVRELERFQVFVCGVPVAGAAPGVGPSPNCSGAQVTVIILDENDNDPLLVYPLPAETIFVGNRFRVGQPVARIRASDLDSGENGRLVFRFDDDNNNSNNRSVQEEGADYFRLDENSGEILAGRDLARVAHLNLTLHLVVSDCGTPSPRSVGAVFGLIVNETLSPPPGATADEAGRVTTTTTLAEHNLVVVIVIACVSGLIAVLLLVSIFCVLRKMSSSSSGKPPRRASSDAPPRSAYSNRNGVEAKDIAMTTNTDLPTITEGPRGAIKSSSSSLSAFEDDFPLFYNISHYPEAHVWPESKQYPGSYNDAKDERDSKEGDLRSSSIGRRLSPTLHSSDSGRGSSDDGPARKQNSHPQSSFPNRAQDSETVPSSKESSTFVSSNLLSSFKQPSTIDSRRDGDNNDLLGNNTRHRPNVRQATSQISIAHNNPKKVLWNSLENDRQKVKQLTSTLDDERFCRNHPQLLVDCNAFPIENNCGSFV